MGEKDEHKRKKTLIDPRFQFHYLSVWLITAGLLIVVSGIFYFAIKRIPQHMDPVLAEDIQIILIGNAVFIIFLAFLMGLYSIIHTHRVSGPAYRIDLFLKDLIATNDFSPKIALRRKDYLQNVAESLNDLMEKLDKRQLEISEILLKTEGLQNDLKEIKDVPEYVGQTLTEIYDKLFKINKKTELEEEETEKEE